MISMNLRNSFDSVYDYLDKLKRINVDSLLKSAGAKGVEALTASTPVDTGYTAASWSYEIKKQSGGAVIEWHNSNLQNGYNIAVLIEYGHGTNGGGYVHRRPYINPALRPVIDELMEALGKEV